MTKTKAQLIEKYRHFNVEHGWWDSTYDCFKERMECIGIDVDKMYFSGFWSQGDGACFEGSVSDWRLFLTSLGYTDEVLIQHAVGNFRFSVKHSGYYYHENCTNFSIDLPNPAGESDEWFIETYSPYPVDDLRSQAWLAVLRNFDLSSMEDEFTKVFRDHMRQLYKELRDEHEYLTSDEAVWESLKANDMTDELEET